MVEPDLVGLPAKQDRRAEFMFLEVERMKNARVVETLQNPEFLKCTSADGLTRYAGTRHRIQPHSADIVGCGMLGMKILEGEKLILFDQVLKNVVSHAALALRRAYSSIIKSLSDPFGCWPVKDHSVCRDAADVIALEQGGNDSGGLVARLSHTDAHALGVGQSHAYAWSGEEDHRLDP